ncbi:MAG: hypothetical protein ACLQFR_28765 [Streptosporangiaceae bacterium]
MSAGYSYTTLSSRPGEPVRVGVSFYLDERAWIVVAGAGSATPHLTVSHGDVSVSIGPASPGQVTGQDARIARKLAEHAAAYATEIERLAAGDGPGNAAA